MNSIVQWLEHVIVPIFDAARFEAVVGDIPEKVLWSGAAYAGASQRHLVEWGAILVVLSLTIAASAVFVHFQAKRNPEGGAATAATSIAGLAPLVLVIAGMSAGFGCFLNARGNATMGYALTEDRILVVPGTGTDAPRSIPLKSLRAASLGIDGTIAITGRPEIFISIAQPTGGDAVLREAVERVVALGASQGGRLVGPGIERSTPDSNRVWRLVTILIGLILSLSAIFGSIALWDRYPRLAVLVGSLSMYPAIAMGPPSTIGTNMIAGSNLSILALLAIFMFGLPGCNAPRRPANP